MDNSWLKLYRKTLNSDIWKHCNPLDLKVFIAVLLSVNYKEHTIPTENGFITIPIGSMLTSAEQIRNLLYENVSTKQVRTSIKKIENLGIWSYKTERRKTFITLVNWELYQLENKTEVTQTVTIRESQCNTNVNTIRKKESKKVNNKKENTHFSSATIPSNNFNKSTIRESIDKFATAPDPGAESSPGTKKDNEILEIFGYWNLQTDIKKHKSLTKQFKTTIKKHIDFKNYTVAEIKKAISNYNLIYSAPNNNGYGGKQRWTIKEFLDRGLDNFESLEDAKLKYLEADKAPVSDLKSNTYTNNYILDEITEVEEYRRNLAIENDKLKDRFFKTYKIGEIVETDKGKFLIETNEYVRSTTNNAGIGLLVFIKDLLSKKINIINKRN